ncbi:hypothetical protein, partial [Sphingomonas sp.]|uniref:hypothetical protein n=1 Tax=Sphingomonas sp. TaxID=28214 RepID=UPI0025862E5F
RVGERRKVSLGEARYLNRVCTQDDVQRLTEIAGWADSLEARHLIQAAIVNAGHRPGVGG